MKSYINFINKYKLAILLIIPATVLVLTFWLRNIEYDSGYRIWFAKDSKALKEYDYFKNVFGSDDLVIISFKDEEGIFNKKAISSIHRLTNKFWKTKHIEQVLSLTNVPYISTSIDEPDEIIIEDFISDYKNSNLNKKKTAVLKEPIIYKTFVNESLNTTIITIKLSAKVRDIQNNSIEVYNSIKKILDEESLKTNYKYHIAGPLAVQAGFTTIIIKELIIFIPVITFFVSVLLFLIYRRINAVIIPTSIVGLSILSIISILVIFGYKINNFTADLPVFLLAIGIASSIHIYTSWQNFINEGFENIQAIEKSMSKNLKAVSLTALTTIIGFLSLCISNLIPVFTLGLASGIGVFFIYILTIVFLPALLLYSKVEKKQTKKLNLKMENYGNFIINNSNKIIYTTLLLFVFFLVGISKLDVDSNLIKFLHKNVEARQSSDFLTKNITGPMSYQVIVDSKEKDGIKQVEFLLKIEEFEKEFLNTFKEVRNTSSIVKIIKSMNKVFNKEDENFYKIPKTKEEIAQYLLLYSLSLPQEQNINDNFDVNYRYLRVNVNTNMTYSKKDLQMIKWVENWWSNTKYSAKVYGQTSMFAKMQTDVTNTLIYSITLSTILVSLVMILVFKKLRYLHIYILPNILPFALIFGVMGWLGIKIDLGVAISGAVILGIAVDDTMHFLVKYFESKKYFDNQAKRLNYVMKHSGKAIIITTTILSLAFLTLVFSDFVPNAHFGLVTAIALILALIIDLLFLPALIVKSIK